MAEASRLPSRSQLASNLAATARTPRPRQRRPTHGTVPMLPSRPCSYLSGWDGGPLRVLGLDHGWFGISAADATGAQEIFFIAWACLFLFLVIPCLKLPLVYRWQSRSCSWPCRWPPSARLPPLQASSPRPELSP